MPCRPASAFVASNSTHGPADRCEAIPLGRVRRKAADACGQAGYGSSRSSAPAPWLREDSPSKRRPATAGAAAAPAAVPGRPQAGKNDSCGVKQLLRPEGKPGGAGDPDSARYDGSGGGGGRDRGKMHVSPSHHGQLWGPCAAGPPLSSWEAADRALKGRNAIAMHDRGSSNVRYLLHSGAPEPPPPPAPAVRSGSYGGGAPPSPARRDATGRAHVVGRPGQIFGSCCEVRTTARCPY